MLPPSKATVSTFSSLSPLPSLTLDTNCFKTGPLLIISRKCEDGKSEERLGKEKGELSFDPIESLLLIYKICRRLLQQESTEEGERRESISRHVPVVHCC